jgi:hypothetical protein
MVLWPNAVKFVKLYTSGRFIGRGSNFNYTDPHNRMNTKKRHVSYRISTCDHIDRDVKKISEKCAIQ